MSSDTVSKPSDSYRCWCEKRNTACFGTPNPVAFVTGSAANRVGRCIAKRFYDEQFHVVLQGYSHVADGIEFIRLHHTPPLSMTIVEGDVGDEATLEKWRDTILASHSRVDVVVNSAAIWDPTPLETLSPHDLEKMYRVNVIGSALCGKIMGLQMASQQSGGVIINIGDWATVRPYKNFLAYLPSKHAVVALTQALAVELGERNANIRVNAVLPGPVMLDESISDDRKDQIIQASLLKRLGAPEDVANAALFLATSPFITGVCLPVDGGRTIYAGTSTEPIAHPKAPS